jgi:uncharacterized protein YkwD
MKPVIIIAMVLVLFVGVGLGTSLNNHNDNVNQNDFQDLESKHTNEKPITINDYVSPTVESITNENEKKPITIIRTTSDEKNQILTLEIGSKIDYTESLGVTVMGVSIDKQTPLIEIEIHSFMPLNESHDGSLIVELDRDYLDSQLSTGEDGSFITLLDGIEIKYDEIKKDSISRILKFQIPLGIEIRDGIRLSQTLEIIGTDFLQSPVSHSFKEHKVDLPVQNEPIPYSVPTEIDKTTEEQKSNAEKCDEVGTALIDPLFLKPCYNEDKLSVLIHNTINEQRIKSNLQSISFDNKLGQIAKSHSMDMVIRNYYSHVSLDGLEFWDRYSQSGYLCEVIIGNIIYSGAENIAQNALYDSYSPSVFGRSIIEWKTPEEIAHSIVLGDEPNQGWMNSAGHRKNILESFWNVEGIGVSINDEGLVYVTQNFC